MRMAPSRLPVGGIAPPVFELACRLGRDLRAQQALHQVQGHVDARRSEEHTSELQSPCNLVCRLLLDKNKTSRSKPPVASLRRIFRSPAIVHRATLFNFLAFFSHLDIAPRSCIWPPCREPPPRNTSRT